MATPDPRLLDAAAARLVAATLRGEATHRAAIDALRTAADGWIGLHYAGGGDPTSTAGLAESLSRLGRAEASAGLPRAAETLSRAVEARRRSPSPAGAVDAVALDLALLGTVQMMVDPELALPTLAEATELHGRLAEHDPARWRGPLARSLLCLASVLVDRGRLEEARATAADLLDAIGPDGRVDVDRDAFLRPVAELVAHVAPPDDASPEAAELRARLAALAPRGR